LKKVSKIVAEKTSAENEADATEEALVTEKKNPFDA